MQKTKKAALLISAVFLALAVVNNAGAKTKWGNSYVRSTSYYYSVYSPTYIDGSVYYTAQKKYNKATYLNKLPGNSTIATGTTDGFTLYEINNKLAYDDNAYHLTYDGNTYSAASGAEEINNALVFRESSGDTFDSSDFDLHLGSATKTHAQLASYCSDETDLESLAYSGQILGYNNKYYVNCANGEKTLVFNSAGTKIDEQNNGGVGLAATAGCDGDEVLAATEPARTNYQTNAAAFYKYNGKTILNPQCSNGNLYYYSYDEDPGGLFKNGTLLESGFYTYDYALINGQACWLNGRSNIQCEDGTTTAKPKGGYKVSSLFNNNGKIGLVMYKSNKNWKKYQYFILTKK